MGIIQYYNFEISEVFIFDEFLVNQVKEGIVIQPEHNEILNECVQKHFSGKNMLYISNRVNSYSVNPLTYSEAEKIPNLLGIAMIPKTSLMRKNALYEKKFFDKPYEIFDNLSSAIVWAHSIISEVDNTSQEKNPETDKG